MWGFVVVALAAGVAVISAQESRIVNIEQGPVKGYKDQEYGFYAFKGIPYASVPTGPHRFKAPLPPPTWKSPYETTKDIACPQKKEFYEDNGYSIDIDIKEDCLIANIYVPDTNETNLPVVVSVHGGAFFMGYGNFFIPKMFIEESKVIFVNFNYRLHAHGFLSLGSKDIPGNAGMKDQVALLRWVKKNIHHFGGNPDDVTLHGPSAGSASVDLLMLSKSAEGLFNKVIPESGSSIAQFTIQADPLANAKKYAKFLNFTNVDDISALENFYKTVPFDVLVSDPFFNEPNSAFMFSPCVERPIYGEDTFLDKSPVDILKSGNYKKVPLLYGLSNMEGLIRIDLFAQWKVKMNEKFSDFLPADLKFDSEQKKEEVAQTVKEFYFGDKPVSEENVLSYVDFFTDVMFAYSSLRTVKYHLANGHDQIYLYMYSFTDENTPFVPHTQTKGAVHCAQTIAIGAFKPAQLKLNSKEFAKVSSIVRRLWGNFIKTGKPVPEGSDLPAWPPASKPWAPHMHIDHELQLKGSMLEERMLFWDDIYSRHYRDPVPAPVPPSIKAEL